MLFTFFLLAVGKKADAQVDLGELKKVTLIPYIPVRIEIKGDTLVEEIEKRVTAYLKQKKYKIISESEWEEKIKQFFLETNERLMTHDQNVSTDILVDKYINSPTVVQGIKINYQNVHIVGNKIYAGFLKWHVGRFPIGKDKNPAKIVDESFLAENTLEEVIEKILNIITLK